MTLLKAHELSLALTTLAAYLAVLLGGALPVTAWVACVAPVIALALKFNGRQAPVQAKEGKWVTLVGVCALGGGLFALVQFGLEAAVLAGTYSVMALLAARLLSRGGLRDDGQAILLAFLVLTAGAALNHSISYALCFVVFCLTALVCLTTRELLARASASDDVAVWNKVCARTDVVGLRFIVICAITASVVAMITGIFFTAFPRVGLGALPFLGGKDGALPDSVSLNNGAIRTLGGGTVVARVGGISREHFERGLYLRGPVFDVVGLEGASKGPEERSIPLPRAGIENISYSVELQPVAADTVFALGQVETLRVIKGGAKNPNLRSSTVLNTSRGETLFLHPLSSAAHYRVMGGLSFPGDKSEGSSFKADLKSLKLTLQKSGDSDVAALAQSLLKDPKNRREAADQIREHFRSFRYTLDEKSADDIPLRAFFFEHQSGHCEFFATAFVLLLREANIPARMVGGFQGGQWDSDTQEVRFTGSHAHAWVEWLNEDGQWVIDDATPQAQMKPQDLRGFAQLYDRALRFWDDQVVDYAFADQMRSLNSLSQGARNAGPWVVLMVVLTAMSLLVLPIIRYFKNRQHDSRVPLVVYFEQYIHAHDPEALLQERTFRELLAAISPLPPTDSALLAKVVGRIEALSYEQYPASLDEDEEMEEALRARVQRVKAESKVKNRRRA